MQRAFTLETQPRVPSFPLQSLASNMVCPACWLSPQAVAWVIHRTAWNRDTASRLLGDIDLCHNLSINERKNGNVKK